MTNSTTQGTDDALLPCPFCGAPAEFDEDHGYYNAKGELRRQVAIFCTGCSANMCWPRDDFKGWDNENIVHGITSEWNRRAPSPTAQEGLVETAITAEMVTAAEAEYSHSTEKPVDLLDILIRTSCPPDGIIGDMFAGSGAAGEAARRSGRNYFGCEIDPDMAAKARARLSEKFDLVTL